MSSDSDSNIDEYCSIKTYQSHGDLRLQVWYTNPERPLEKKPSKSPFSRSILMRDIVSTGDIVLPLDLSKFGISQSDDHNRASVAYALYSIEKLILNKYKRSEFVFDFLRDYCDSNHFIVGDNEFVRVESEEGKWFLFCKEAWCDDIGIEKLETQNISLARVDRGRGTSLYYHKDFGYLEKPRGWEFFPSGNACITKRVKSNGPIWTIVEFESRGRHGSVKSVPVTKGYVAPMEHLSEAKQYYEKNRLSLLNRKIMRKLKGETSLSKKEKRTSSLSEMKLTDDQVELFRKIIKDNKTKL